MSDYDYWTAKLAGEDPDPPADRTQLPCGFWRMRDNSPLAVWIDGDRRIALRGFDPPSEMSQAWMERVAEQGGFGVAITDGAYWEARNQGRWPDTDPVVAAQVGHNKGPTDEAEILKEQIESAIAGIKDYAEVTDDEMAARAQSLRSRITELKGKVEKAHKKEKAPHLEACKAVDNKWLPLAKEADAAAKKVRDAISAHETRKLKAERQRREEERRKAEEWARETGKPEPLFQSEPAPAEPAAPARVKGGYGRAAVVKEVKVVTAITDPQALFGFLQAQVELRELMMKLAQRAVDAGQSVPGVEIEERRKVA